MMDEIPLTEEEFSREMQKVYDLVGENAPITVRLTAEEIHHLLLRRQQHEIAYLQNGETLEEWWGRITRDIPNNSQFPKDPTR